jgi:hypothetical protein
MTDKPTALITASTGGERGHESMLYTLAALSAKVAEGNAVLISSVRSKIKDGKIADENMKRSLQAALDSLFRSIN